MNAAHPVGIGFHADATCRRAAHRRFIGLEVTYARSLAIVALLAACSSSSREVANGGDARLDAVTIMDRCPGDTVVAEGIRTAQGVVYASHGGRHLRLDLAWSDARARAPLVILLHGGAWAGGSRTSMHEEMRALARRGYTAASIAYRLTEAPRNVFPAAISDVRCALRVLRRRADEYRIDPERVAVMGYSAGGHLASLLGVGADIEALGGGCGDSAMPDAGSVRVQAVVSYAGPQDLRVNQPYTQEQADIVTNFLGVFPGDDPATANLASPIVHVSAGDPAFLFVHGRADDLVPVEHPRKMAAALRRVGTPATVLELDGGHDYVGLAASRNSTVRCTVHAFLERWVKGE